jgi:hypothetical protein
MKKKLFVLVRKDLGRSAKAAQAVHGASGFVVKHGTAVWPNEIIVLLAVRDEADLIRWAVRLARCSTHLYEWHEPDMNNELTAVAAFGEAVECAVAELPLLK